MNAWSLIMLSAFESVIMLSWQMFPCILSCPALSYLVCVRPVLLFLLCVVYVWLVCQMWIGHSSPSSLVVEGEVATPLQTRMIGVGKETKPASMFVALRSKDRSFCAAKRALSMCVHDNGSSGLPSGLTALL